MGNSTETYHKDHWVEIEPDRLERYERMFQLDDDRADQVLAGVGAQGGETIVDFGCGPGFVANQLARLAGPDGHVHAVDVNADFVERARRLAAETGRSGRITVHHSLDEKVPLPNDSADRIYARNVLEYVPDADMVLAELHRILKPGGTMVASDSDFGFVVVAPLTPAETAELFGAAAPAFREPNIGRKLPGAFRRAGLSDVRTRVLTSVDERGHMRGMVENMIGYGLSFDRLTAERADELRSKLDAGMADGSYLAALPQWWVTGTK
ncbi:MAG: methyltransferase domain-containing protein [Actinomycetia bacterium]|nr:methyltransferase domain-containing protein [Actinomycetes bacterium]